MGVVWSITATIRRSIIVYSRTMSQPDLGRHVYPEQQWTVMSSTIYNNSSASSTASVPYGDGVYYLSGNVKFYSNIIWSRSNSSSVGLVAAGTSETLDYDDIQNNANLLSSYSAYVSNHNISSVPVFGNSGNYTGPDGLWGTLDDGLHQSTSSPGCGYRNKQCIW